MINSMRIHLPQVTEGDLKFYIKRVLRCFFKGLRHVHNTHRNHLALSWHVGGAVTKTEFSLEGVEVCFQLGFLLYTWWLVFTPEMFANNTHLNP